MSVLKNQSMPPALFFQEAIRGSGLLGYRDAFEGCALDELRADIKAEFSRWDCDQDKGLPKLDEWMSKQVGDADKPPSQFDRRAAIIAMLVGFSPESGEETPGAREITWLAQEIIERLLQLYKIQRHNYWPWLGLSQHSLWCALWLAPAWIQMLTQPHQVLSLMHPRAKVFRSLEPRKLLRELTSGTSADADTAAFSAQQLWWRHVMDEKCRGMSVEDAAAKLGFADAKPLREILKGASIPSWRSVRAASSDDVALIHANLYARCIDAAWCALIRAFGSNTEAWGFRKIMSGADEHIRAIEESVIKTWVHERIHSTESLIEKALQPIIADEMERSCILLHESMSGNPTPPFEPRLAYVVRLGEKLGVLGKPPEAEVGFYKALQCLSEDTDPKQPASADARQEFANKIASLRREFPVTSKANAHALSIIEARLVLRDESIGIRAQMTGYAELLIRAWRELQTGKACQDPASVSVMAAGALAWLSRHGERKLAGKSIDPLLKELLSHVDAWADKPTFSHPDFDRRKELAAKSWEKTLDPELLKTLRVGFGDARTHPIEVVPGIFASVARPESPKTIRANKATPVADPHSGRDQTALMMDIRSGDKDAARRRIENPKTNLNFSNGTKDTALTYALCGGHYDLTLAILRRQENPMTTKTILQTTGIGRSAIWYAILHGHVEILKELENPSVPATVRAPIDFSKIRIHEEDVLTRQPSPETYTPLYFALKRLIYVQHGPMRGDLGKNQLKFPQNPQGIYECVDFLIGCAGDSIDAPHVSGFSALMYAAEFGLDAVCTKLLDAGAKIDYATAQGQTALITAVNNRHYSTVALLLRRGASTEIQTLTKQGDKYTALSLAKRMNDSRMLELLIRRGAGRENLN